MKKLPVPGCGAADDPALWIEFAKSDLAIARIGRKPDVHLGALCFHCQQAAEKAVKSVLVGHRVAFPKIHDIGKLLDLVPQVLQPPPKVRDAVLLTDYAETGRYPMYIEDVDERELAEAVRLAEAVVDWAEKTLGEAGKGRTGVREAQAAYGSGAAKRKMRKAAGRKKR